MTIYKVTSDSITKDLYFTNLNNAIKATISFFNEFLFDWYDEEEQNDIIEAIKTGNCTELKRQEYGFSIETIITEEENREYFDRWE